MPENIEFFTAQEVADSLRVDVKTVYRWIKSGKAKAIKAGKSWRLSRDTVESIKAEGVGAADASKKE